MPASVHIKENSWLAALAARKMRSAQMAIVWRRTIHLHGVTPDEFLQVKSWVLHELKHVEQYAGAGWFVFTIKYLYYSLRYGYFNNPLEQEARAAENDHTLLNRYEIHRHGH